MVETMQHSIDYEATYNPAATDKSTLTKVIEIDWLTFLHETRCPICLCRFNTTEPTANAPDRYRTKDL
jgi:hypothetical protein